MFNVIEAYLNLPSACLINNHLICRPGTDAPWEALHEHQWLNCHHSHEVHKFSSPCLILILIIFWWLQFFRIMMISLKCEKYLFLLFHFHLHVTPLFNWYWPKEERNILYLMYFVALLRISCSYKYLYRETFMRPDCGLLTQSVAFKKW